MKKMLGFAIVAAACALITMRPTAADPPSPTATPTVEELMQIIDRLHERIAELEARVEQLEAAALEPSKPAPAGASVMVITSIEPTDPDPDLLSKIAALERDAKVADEAALDADKDAAKHISSGSKSRSEWMRNQDRENDAKRKDSLDRANDHRQRAMQLRGEAARLQRKIDERGPLIRGWNGSRRVVLELTKALPNGLRNLLPGEFITWKGAVRQGDATVEIWTATSIERTSRPATFKDELESAN